MPRKPARPVLPLHDQRMLELIDYIVKEQIDGFTIKTTALAAIGFNQANLSQVMNGKRSFTPTHIMKAVEVFGADANFFFIKRHTKMMLQGKNTSAIVELRLAVARVANELNQS